MPPVCRAPEPSALRARIMLPEWRPPRPASLPGSAALAVETTVEAEGQRDGDLAGSNVSERGGPRQPVGGREVERVDGPQRLLAAELGGPVEAALVDGHDVDALPVVAQGAAEAVARRPGCRRPGRRA